MPKLQQRTQIDSDQARGFMILNALPDDDDWEFERLSNWEQEFISDLRSRQERLVLTGPMLDKLEQIWGKMNG